jgi:acetylornithine deacetylase/succinyl-diaminopimelate desuccinylase-like protein
MTTQDSTINFLRVASIQEVLSQFVAFKSVSSDPTCKNECWKAAKFCYNLLESHGFETKIAGGKLM